MTEAIAKKGHLAPRHVALAIFTGLAVIYILAPLAVVVLNSFSSVPFNVFPPPGYSLRWYDNLAKQDSFYLAAVRSIVLALVATAIALVIGTMAAYALVRYRLPGRDLIKAFLMSPLVLPKIVLGVAMFMFFVRIKMFGGYSSLVLTHVLVVLPFVIAIVSAALFNFDWSLQEAAMDLGARPLTTFRRVVLPQISVSLVVSGLLAFITSFDQVETTIFITRPGTSTLPIEMFIYLQKWQDPTIAALSAVLILFAAILLAGLSLVLSSRASIDLVKARTEGPS